jgi:DNA repair protein RecO (recombination protein O)
LSRPLTAALFRQGGRRALKEKLLLLLAFLSIGGCRDEDELRQGLDLRGFFPERHVFWPQ